MANLVTSTEALDDVAVWTASSVTVTANTFAAPSTADVGAGLADTVADASGVVQGAIVGTYYTIPADTNDYVGSVYVRKDATTTRWPDVGIQINSGVAGYVNLNTSTGAVADGPFGAPAASGIVDVDANWWRVWLRVANNGAGTGIRIQCFPDHLDALGGSGTSSGTGSVVLWGFNLTQSTTVQTYIPEPFYGSGGVALSGVVGTTHLGTITRSAPSLLRLPIDVGSIVGDPTAEQIRSGFTKTNTMMAELYNTLAPSGSVLTINTGGFIDDASSDSMRTSFGKVNTMASDLYAIAGGVRPVINAGAFDNDVSAETIYSAFSKINTITADLYGSLALYGPRIVSQPASSVTIAAGANIQTAVTANPAGTVFWLRAGTYNITSSITPKANQSFVGEYGATLDGSGWTTSDAVPADRDKGFFIGVNNGITGVTISNLIITNGPEYGVNAYLTAANWIVEYCEISYNRNGVSCGDHMIVRHNWIHHNIGLFENADATLRGGGINGNCAQGTSVTYNDISYNGQEQKFIYGTIGAVNQDLYIAYNFFHHNVLDAIWIDGDGRNSTIEHNTVEDNGRAGITVEIGTTVIVRNNNCNRNSSEGILISASRDCTVTSNTCHDNDFGIGLFLDFTRLAESYPGWTIDLSGNTITGNEVRVPSGGSKYAAILSFQSAGTQTPYLNNSKLNNFQSNTYLVPNNPTSGTNWFVWNGNKIFSQWQALPQDTLGSIAIG